MGENASRKCNPIKWYLECQTAFDQLKELCPTTPILAYADFTKPFKLHTDASVLGLGAVLYQFHKSVEKVISYANRSLTQSETIYPVHKLEFLCLKWDVYTDNNPNYNFHLPYQSGRNIVEVDASSRIDWGKNDQTLPAESIQAIMTAALTGQGKDYIEAIPCGQQVIESFVLYIHENAQVVCKSMTMPEIDSDSDSSCGLDPS